eukprot:809182-Amphidinium_carterae.1
MTSLERQLQALYGLAQVVETSIHKVAVLLAVLEGHCVCCHKHLPGANNTVSVRQMAVAGWSSVWQKAKVLTNAELRLVRGEWMLRFHSFFIFGKRNGSASQAVEALGAKVDGAR